MADSSDLDFGATVRSLAPGLRFFGRFTLVRPLGRGGMGVVWLAHDGKLELDVAVKFLPEAVGADEAAVADLARETRRARELAHPHIVRVYDFHQDERLAGISMEWVDGGTLTSRRLQQPGQIFEPPQLSAWVRHCCAALEYAHDDARIVHRDLKPANLMVDARDRLKIADFGISASVSESVTRVSRVASSSGSPPYMSPQQMLGERPSPSDDIYALGATLYELLTGKPPFFSGNIALQVQNKVPPSLAERRRELGVNGPPISPDWEQTVMACLAKETKDRPGTVAEIVERLGLSRVPPPKSSGATSSPVRPPPATAVDPPPKRTTLTFEEKPPPPKPKRRRLAALVGIMLLAVGAGYYFGVYAPEQQRQAGLRRIEAEQRDAEATREQAGREAAEQEAASRAEDERKNHAAIVAKIDAFVNGASVAQRTVTETAVKTYLATASAKYSVDVDARWRERLSGWEIARLVAARGGITVRTQPVGANVTVGELEPGPGPLTLQDVKPGAYPVKVQAVGYDDWNGEVEVKANEAVDVRATLVRSTGGAQITSNPAGLRFVLKSSDRTEQGITPARIEKLPTGVYALTVTRAGWPDARQTLTVNRNQTASGQVEFAGGTLEITSRPGGADVSAQDKILGRTPLSFTDLAPGNYTFDFSHSGYRTSSRSIILTPGGRLVIEEQMQPDFAGTFAGVWTEPGGRSYTRRLVINPDVSTGTDSVVRTSGEHLTLQLTARVEGTTLRARNETIGDRWTADNMTITMVEDGSAIDIAVIDDRQRAENGRLQRVTGFVGTFAGPWTTHGGRTYQRQIVINPDLSTGTDSVGTYTGEHLDLRMTAWLDGGTLKARTETIVGVWTADNMTITLVEGGAAIDVAIIDDNQTTESGRLNRAR